MYGNIIIYYYLMFPMFWSKCSTGIYKLNVLKMRWKIVLIVENLLFIALWETSAITNRKTYRQHDEASRNFRHIPSPHRASQTTVDWEVGLREAVHQALLREHYLEPNLQLRLQRAPIIGKQNSATPFGDIAVLARGQLYGLSGGNFAFVQDPYSNDCDECHNARIRRCGIHQCEVWKPQHHERLIALWTVKRLRHRSLNNYHYEIEYTISTMTPVIREAFVKRDGRFDYALPGHVFVVRNDGNYNKPTETYTEVYNRRFPNKNFNQEVLIGVDSNGKKHFLHSYPGFYTSSKPASTNDPKEIELYRKLIETLASKTSTTKKEEGPFRISLNHYGDTTKPSHHGQTKPMESSMPKYVPVKVPEGNKTTKPVNHTSSTIKVDHRNETTRTPQRITPSIKTTFHYFMAEEDEKEEGRGLSTKQMEKVPLLTKPATPKKTTIKKITTTESYGADFLFPTEATSAKPKKKYKPTKTKIKTETEGDFLFTTQIIKPVKKYGKLSTETTNSFATQKMTTPALTTMALPFIVMESTKSIQKFEKLTSVTTPASTTTGKMSNVDFSIPALPASSQSVSTSQTSTLVSTISKSVDTTTKIPKIITTTATKITTMATPWQTTVSSTPPTATSTMKNTETDVTYSKQPVLTTSSFLSTDLLTTKLTKRPKPSKYTQIPTINTTHITTSTMMPEIMLTTVKLTSPSTQTQRPSTRPLTRTTKSSTRTSSVTKINLPAKTKPRKPSFISKLASRLPSKYSSKFTRPYTTSTSSLPTPAPTTKVIKPPTTISIFKSTIPLTTMPSTVIPSSRLFTTSRLPETTTITSKSTIPFTTTIKTMDEFDTIFTQIHTDSTNSQLTIVPLTTKTTTTPKTDSTRPQLTTIPLTTKTTAMPKTDSTNSQLTTEPLATMTMEIPKTDSTSPQWTTVPLTTKTTTIPKTYSTKPQLTTVPLTTMTTAIPKTLPTEFTFLTSTLSQPTTETSTEKIIFTTTKQEDTTTDTDYRIIQELQPTEPMKITTEVTQSASFEKDFVTTKSTLTTPRETKITELETFKTTKEERASTTSNDMEFTITTKSSTEFTKDSTTNNLETTKTVTDYKTTTITTMSPKSDQKFTKASTSTPHLTSTSSSFLTNEEPIKEPINIKPLVKDYNYDDIFGTTKSTTKPTTKSMLKNTESDLALQLFDKNRKRGFENSKVIFSNFYEASTTEETVPKEELRTSQSVETSISYEVNKRKKSSLTNLEYLPPLNTVVGEKGKIGTNVTENSRTLFDNLATQLVNHARTIDYLSRNETKTSSRPKYRKRKNYIPRSRKVNKKRITPKDSN